jgi:hypothetical protein
MPMPTSEEPEWVRLNVQLRPDQHDWLRRRAFEERSSIAALIRRFVDEGRVRMEPQQELPLPRDEGR